MFSLDIRHCLKSKLSGNGTKLNCLKSKQVRISDIHCKIKSSHMLCAMKSAKIESAKWQKMRAPNLYYFKCQKLQVREEARERGRTDVGERVPP